MNRAPRQAGDGEIAEVEIIAHRGANREAPENTIPAFQRALEIGVHGIELDVRITRDGVPIVHHDATLPGGGSIEELDLAEIARRANAPSLEEVLQLIDGQCHVYVEIKAEYALIPSVELLKVRSDWCSLHSFDHRIALGARVLAPNVKTGILLVSRLVDPAHAFHAARATDVWQHADYLDRGVIAEAHNEGARVIAWTVNDIARAGELKAIGVDGICTDDPRELLQGLHGTTP
jgi:glycerophosphoryl diester phosphodiesterase